MDGRLAATNGDNLVRRGELTLPVARSSAKNPLIRKLFALALRIIHRGDAEVAVEIDLEMTCAKSALQPGQTRCAGHTRARSFRFSCALVYVMNSEPVRLKSGNVLLLVAS